MAVEMVLTLGQAFEVAYQLAMLKNGTSATAVETTAHDNNSADVAAVSKPAALSANSTTSPTGQRPQARPRTTPPVINSVRPLQVKPMPQTAAAVVVATDRL